MKQVFLSLTLLIVSVSLKAQTKVEWDPSYQIQLSDFRSPSTQIGGTTTSYLNTATGMDFSFYMSSAEFMFTKNFNSKVNCTFDKSAAFIVAPDSSIAGDLLHYARYEFDLTELYARKFRKRLFEEKGAFSDVNFFQPVYDEIQRELSRRHAESGKATELGRDREKLKDLHAEVRKEIEELSDFCKTCKPPKKKK